jgi:hypothetical protein
VDKSKPWEDCTEEEKHLRMQNALSLTFERLLCAKHGEPFRPEWPRGYAHYAARYLGHIPIEQVKTEITAAGLYGKPIPDQMGFLLDRKPLCCRLGNDKMLEIYDVLELGRLAFCPVCHQNRRGGEVKIHNFWGRPKKYPHICFGCLATQTVFHGTNN